MSNNFKGFQGLDRISKDVEGFRRIPTPFTPYATNLFIVLFVLFSVLVPPPNLLCRKSINLIPLSSKNFKWFRDNAVLMAVGWLGPRHEPWGRAGYAKSMRGVLAPPLRARGLLATNIKRFWNHFRRFQRIPQDSKRFWRVPKDVKQFQRIPRDWKESQ